MNSVTAHVVLATAGSGPGVRPAHLVWLLLFGVIGLALLALFVRVLVSIITSDRSPGAKVLWVLFAFWLPVLTWFAWYLWGRPAGPRKPGLAL